MDLFVEKKERREIGWIRDGKLKGQNRSGEEKLKQQMFDLKIEHSIRK